jgi:hypothetical protein
MVLCTGTYLSVNGALEVSAEGAEGVVLGGKVQIHLHQRGLGGRGHGDGRYGEDVDGNLKLSVHCTELAEDAAGLLGQHQREAEFLGLVVPGGREEGRGLVVPNAWTQPVAPLVQGLCSGVYGVLVHAHVDDGGSASLGSPRS